MIPDWQAYQDHFDRVLSEASPANRRELQRLQLAPFASDPAVTLRPGRLMVVSMKPYGAPGRTYDFGGEERERQPGLHRWYDGGRRGSNFVREANQLVQLILRELSLHLRPRQVFNTYAYFYRAADAKQLKSLGLAQIDCSVFHRQFIAIVQPELILCIGNGPAPSAFATYQKLYGDPKIEELRCAPRTLLRYFMAETGPLVLGIPHLSYVRTAVLAPRVEELLERLK